MAVAESRVDERDGGFSVDAFALVLLGFWCTVLLVWWCFGFRKPTTPILHHSSPLSSIPFSWFFDIDIRSDPVMGRRCVALTGCVFGEKNVARMEGLAATVSETDLDAAG